LFRPTNNGLRVSREESFRKGRRVAL
jgi:hypothetical protein